MEPTKLISRSVVARRLGVGRPRVALLADQLGEVRIEGRYFYDSDRVEAYAAAHPPIDITGLMTCAEAARLARCTPGNLMLLDDQLAPVIDRRGERVRRYYRPERILAWVRERESDKVTREQRRRDRSAR